MSQKKICFSDGLNFWIESICLSSVGKEFHTVVAVEENERCPNVIACGQEIHGILLSEERRCLFGV